MQCLPCTRLSMDQPVLMTGLVYGDRLPQDIALCTLLLSGVNRACQDWVQLENQRLWAEQMREVKELVAGMKEAMASLKSVSADAKDHLASEMLRAKVNASKVKSLAVELSEANKEAEDFLGETGSNFSLSETSNTPAPRTDANGVTLNTESTK